MVTGRGGVSGLQASAEHTEDLPECRGIGGWIEAFRQTAAAGWLGLRDVRVLDMDEDGNGLGVIGTLPDPMAPKDFLRGMKAALGLSTVRHSQLPRTPLRTVAVCGGSGRSLISKASAAGADVYVSADIPYHDFYAPDGMMIADIGHFESESKIMDVICGIVREKFPNFAVRTAVRSTVNPVYYF